MKHRSSAIATLVLSLMVPWLGSGCVTPAGYTAAEFNALPPEKRQELLDQERAKARARMAEANAERQQQQQAKEAALLERKQSPKYGDVVSLSFQSGSASWRGSRLPIIPQTVDIVRGDSVSVHMRTSDWRVEGFLNITLSEDSGTLYITDYKYLENTGIERGQPVWAHGKQYRLEQKIETQFGLKDVVVFVQYKRL